MAKKLGVRSEYRTSGTREDLNKLESFFGVGLFH
jgi:hypothetical protein